MNIIQKFFHDKKVSIEAKRAHASHKEEGLKLIEAARKGKEFEVIKILSAVNNHPEVVNYAPFIRKEKAGGEIQMIRKATALGVAANAGHLQIVRALLAVPGINVNTRDGEDRRSTPLTSAILGGHIDVVRELALFPNLNPDLPGWGGKTPLMLAMANCIEAVPVLLDVKTLDVNARDTGESTALHQAVRCAHKKEMDFVELLLKKPNILVDAQDKYGNTPLMLAVMKGRVHDVELLVQAGADQHVKNKEGMSALNLADKVPHKEINKLLEDSVRATHRNAVEIKRA